MTGSKILHFAAEEELSKKFLKNVKEYIMGDLKPGNPDTIKIDITTIQYPNNYFDIIICNHVLDFLTIKKQLRKSFVF